MNKQLKNKEMVNNITNQAIRYLKSNPCCCCSVERWCDVAYKGTCPIFKELKSRFSKIEEIDE